MNGKKLFLVGLIAAFLATPFFMACSSDNAKEELKDTTPPTISLKKKEIDVTSGKAVRIDGNHLYIGSDLVATSSDNVTKNCSITLLLNGKAIASGTMLNDEGTLTIKASDEAGNTATSTVKLTVVRNAPRITVMAGKFNVFGGIKVTISDHQLLFEDSIVATVQDENLETCTYSLNFNGMEIKSGDSVNEAGTLTFTATNKYQKTSKADIIFTNDAIYGLDNLKNASMQVGQEIDLLKGITFADGVTLVKTEIEIEGRTYTIPDPHHYIPEYSGNNDISIIFTVQGRNGEPSKIAVNYLTIAPLEYKSITINHLKPSDILPIVGQVNGGDKKCYEHIEHLRVAEATKIRDMMRQYGTSKHTPEQYQQLMSRLSTGMAGENPIGFTNYEVVGGPLAREPTEHAHNERDTLNNLIKHAKFIVIDGNNDRTIDLYNLCKSNPNQIIIIGSSVGRQIRKDQYDQQVIEQRKQYEKEKNLLIFEAAGNIREDRDGILHTKIYQEDYDLPDEHSFYTQSSHAHNKNDATLDRHLMVTFGTNKNGDIDQTNEDVESSLFPVGFHDKVIFAGREFPYNVLGGGVGAQTYKYATSFTNYVNVAMTDLCFQMFAEVKDVDQLLDMIRSTCLTDYIRFDLNGDGDTNDNYKGQPESQPLQLINPAGFFQKYLMPNNLPSSVKTAGTASLSKGYYKGVIFDIPGAEVKIDGQWIAYNDQNKKIIKAQSPMNLEWRINGDLCKKMGYESSKSVTGSIIVVDDQWNGLNMTKDFSITLTP